jgi:hypothetical protein
MLFKDNIDTLPDALRQAEAGGAIFPVYGITPDGRCACGKLDCNNAGKHPACANGVNDATVDPKEIVALWAGRKNINIGLATGARSTVWALDVDGEEGEKTLAALVAKHYPLPATLESHTGRGRHLFFRYPGVKVINRAGLGLKLDVRGDGGYVVIPPSRHKTGVSYAYKDGTAAVAISPAWLVQLVTEQKQSNADRRQAQAAELQELIKGVQAGQRNDAIARIAGKLLSLPGLDPRFSLEIILAFNDARCKPPLPHSEVITTVNSIASRELTKRKGKHHG